MGSMRLGDIIDDYCPRCRLLTNHSVMALVGDEVKKVVCRTCNHNHDFKHGQGGEKKKASKKQSAYEQVLASVMAGKTTEAPAKVEPVVRRSRSLAAGRARVAPPPRTPKAAPPTAEKTRPSRPR
jgi:NMD protein affecting ribosome stability and mRNA decay